MFIRETKTRILEIVIGDVTFTATSDDPDEVKVSSMASNGFDIEDGERLNNLVELADTLRKFRDSVRAER